MGHCFVYIFVQVAWWGNCTDIVVTLGFFFHNIETKNAPHGFSSGQITTFPTVFNFVDWLILVVCTCMNASIHSISRTFNNIVSSIIRTL